jgi:hypothetical protein
MAYENENLQNPVAEPTAQVEELILNIEELEDRAAPSAVWGT